MVKKSNKWLSFCAAIFLITTFSCSNASSDNSSSGKSSADTIIKNFDAGLSIFEGSHDFGNWGEHLNSESDSEGYKKIWLRFNCKGFSEGDQIQITHKQSDIYTEKAILEICGDASDWDNSMLTKGSLINATRKSSSEKDIIPETKNQTTAYTLTAQDAAKLNNSKCFVVLGCGITIEKVVVSSQKTIACNSIKNGWQGYDFDKDSGAHPEAVPDRNGYGTISTNTPYFCLGFIPMTVDSEGLRKDIVTNNTSFVKYMFFYTFEPATKQLNITRTYKVAYQNSSNRIVEILDEISGADNYTLSFDDDKIKFDSLPVTELSDIFYTDRYYSCPIPELKLDGTYTTTVNGHTCTLIVKSGLFVFENPNYYYDNEYKNELIEIDSNYDTITSIKAYYGNFIANDSSIILSIDYWEEFDDKWFHPAEDHKISISYNQDSITINRLDTTEMSFIWTRQ